MRILHGLALVAALAGCASHNPVLHPEGERLAAPPEVQAPLLPPPPPPPPAPRVAVTMAFAPTLPAGVAQSSKALLNSLDGAYLSLAEGAVDLARFEPCVAQAAGSTVCIEGVLTAANAGKGTVVILVSPGGEGTTRWTCVGRPVAPFDAGRQSFDWVRSDAPTAPDAPWPRSVRQSAASCITHAGLQSGW